MSITDGEVGDALTSDLLSLGTDVELLKDDIVGASLSGLLVYVLCRFLCFLGGLKILSTFLEGARRAINSHIAHGKFNSRHRKNKKITSKRKWPQHQYQHQLQLQHRQQHL
jgi:hypothetical protein